MKFNLILLSNNLPMFQGFAAAFLANTVPCDLQTEFIRSGNEKTTEL